MKKKFILAIFTCVAFQFMPILSYSHCDTMDGPVIGDARLAFEKKDVTPILKWIKKENEGNIKDAFNIALKNRIKDEKSKENAEKHFFELLVKIHRAGEGATFEGIKPVGTEIEPAIVEADKALQSGSATNLVNLITKEISEGINKRFSEVSEKKKHVDESVEAGREYVEAYVQYTHYAENLHMMAISKTGHHGDNEKHGHKSDHEHSR